MLQILSKDEQNKLVEYREKYQMRKSILLKYKSNLI